MAKRKGPGPTATVGDSDEDALYALDPGEFVAARDRLAKELKAGGDAQRAEEVRALRRPTVAAWALNQAARRHPEEVTELLEAGRALRQAQDPGRRSGPAGLRAATERRRAAVNLLAERAVTVLAEAQRSSDAQRDAVALTLEAATVDSDVADLLRGGRLEREASPAGALGGFDLWGPDTSGDEPASEGTAAGRRARTKGSADAGGGSRRRKEADALAAAAVEAREAADRSEAEAEATEVEARRAEADAREARARAREARTAAKAAAADAAKAESRARKAKDTDARGG